MKQNINKLKVSTCINMAYVFTYTAHLKKIIRDVTFTISIKFSIRIKQLREVKWHLPSPVFFLVLQVLTQINRESPCLMGSRDLKFHYSGTDRNKGIYSFLRKHRKICCSPKILFTDNPILFNILFIIKLNCVSELKYTPNRIQSFST